MYIWIINHYATPPSLGGLVRHYYFSKYLTKWGHKVKIFTSSMIHNSNVNMIRDNSVFVEKNVDGVDYTFLRTSNYSGNGLARIKNMLEFPARVKKIDKYFEKPDVIYCSSPDLLTANAALKLGRRLGVPVVTEIRDLWPLSITAYNNISDNNIVIKTLYQMEKSIYVKSNGIIHTIPYWYDYIIDKGWDGEIDSKKAININNGVDIDEFEANKKAYVCEDKEMNDSSLFKVVFAGSIRKVYNLKELIRVAESVQNDGINDIVFVFYGDGTEKESLQKYCVDNNISNVYFKGRVPKKYIPDIISKSDVNYISVFDTILREYGCSNNKLFEYLLAGKPIISNVKFKNDLLETNKIGTNVKAGEIEEIKKTILQIKEGKISFCNPMEIAKQYDYKELAKSVEDFLLKVINESSFRMEK